IAADNEMNAHQRAFRKEGQVSADATVERLGKIIADRRPDFAVVTVAWNIDQDRDETIEAVAARQDPRPRTLVKLQNRERELIEHVFFDLKQLVARIGLEHVHQRLAGMARRIEAGAADNAVDLAAEKRDAARR